MPESAAPHYRADGVPIWEGFPFAKTVRKTRIRTSVGDRSSMVELQIVILAVAGSSPVGHPPALRWHVRCFQCILDAKSGGPPNG